MTEADASVKHLNADSSEADNTDPPHNPTSRPGPHVRSDHWKPPALALILFLIACASLLFWLPLQTSSAPGNGQDGRGAGLGDSTQTGNQAATTQQPGDGPQATANQTAGDDTNAQPPNVATQSLHQETPATSPDTNTPTTEPIPAQQANASQEIGFATDLNAVLPDPTPITTTTTPPSQTTTPSGPQGQASAGSEPSDGLTSFFDQPGHGSRFVFLIDKSGSMAGEAFEDARFELIRTLRSLRPHETFYVIFYDNDAEPMPARAPVRATPQNVERYIRWIREVSTGGGTDPTDALRLALTQLRPDTIWLLSDGSFNVAVTDTITRLNPNRRVHINTLAFRNRSGETILRIIADENKGDYRFVGP
ncbi:VWA domain-containing protein [Mucisphaera sp.]|uniref:vWA domain-containing protein n=1 Tax=Mucisphaera sp. TaxID=2913024 RepID=UPI003D0D5DCF